MDQKFNLTGDSTTETTSENTSTDCLNVYCVSEEEYLDMIRQFIYPTFWEWLLIILYVTVFIVGLVGNFLVCFVVWFDRRMRTITNLFIVNLSVADFLVILICMPTTVLADVTETWYIGSAMCKMIQYLQGVSVSVSVLTLTVISVERFFAICFPLRIRTTKRSARVIIVMTWILSFLILLPEVIVLDTHRKFPPELMTILLTTCKPTWPYRYQAGYQMCLIVVLFVVPFGVMGTAYTAIAVCLWRSGVPSETIRLSSYPARRQSEQPGEMSSVMAADTKPVLIRRRKAAKMLIAVVAMFGICYLPVHLLNILRYVEVEMDDKAAIMFALISHWLCYFNSAINPVIYNFMSEKFRGAFRNVLQCKLSESAHPTALGLKSTYRRTQMTNNSPAQHHTAFV